MNRVCELHSGAAIPDPANPRLYRRQAGKGDPQAFTLRGEIIHLEAAAKRRKIADFEQSALAPGAADDTFALQWDAIDLARNLFLFGFLGSEGKADAMTVMPADMGRNGAPMMNGQVNRIAPCEPCFGLEAAAAIGQVVDQEIVRVDTASADQPAPKLYRTAFLARRIAKISFCEFGFGQERLRR